MKLSNEFLFIDLAKDDVASVAVKNGTKLLMGKRRDNERYTLPGGHFEDGEDKFEAAARELKEESGIEVEKKDLKHLGTENVTTFTGKKKTIHAFVIDHNGPTSVKNDPDKEVYRWKWVETKDGLPEEIKTNLHSPKNVVLRKLGLLKGIILLADLHTRLQAPSYVISVSKSRPHKYLRKYRRNNKWVYIYTEGKEHRELSEEAVGHLHKLAELGHEEAHGLVSNAEEVDEKQLKLLHALAELKDPDAIAHLKELQIDPTKPHEPENELTRQLSRESDRMTVSDHEKARQAITGVLERELFGHLDRHSTSPLTQKLAEKGITRTSVFPAIGEQKTIQGMLTALHTQMTRVDIAHKGLSSSNTAARDAGGYGSLVYKKAVKALEDTQLSTGKALPEGYSEVHQRGQGFTPPGEVRETRERQAREKAEREAREKAEREARERVELAEIKGSMAHFMSTIFDRGMSTDQTKKLHKALKNIFGENLRKENWPYNFDEHGLKTKITDVQISDTSISLNMQILNAQGQPIMNGWRRTWSKREGRPHIENSYMAVSPQARTGVQIGNLINSGQRALLRSLPRGGVIHVHANIDIGGYNWANQGFSFDGGRSALNHWRQKLQLFAGQHGIALSDADLMHFTEPVHFAAFNDGKKYVMNVQTMPLSEKQKQTSSLSGVAGEHPLTPDEIQRGSTQRMSVHLGKKFMLNTDWNGTWDSKADTQASKFADQYYQLRERATKYLAPEYKEVISKVASGERAGTPPAPRAVATPHTRSTGSLTVDRYIHYWQPRQRYGGTTRTNISMTESRVRVVMGWSREDVQRFLTHAPLASAAKRRIREALLSAGASR